MSIPRDNKVFYEPLFLSRLLLALLPSLIVLLIFGGKPVILVSAFGCCIAHMFDTMGVLEGSLFAIVFTFLGIFLALIYSARFILQESISNFTMILVMGISIFASVSTIVSAFKSFYLEFDTFFFFMESVVFAVVPLVSSSLLTWFLSIEIPAIDIFVSFPLLYFFFSMLLLTPRESSYSKYLRESNPEINSLAYVVPFSVFRIVWSIPIVMNPILYYAISHNVILIGREHWIGLSLSFLIPAVLMCILLKSCMSYFESSRVESYQWYLDNLILGISLGIGICIQNYPIFDDIKALTFQDQRLTNISISVVFAMILATVVLNRLKNYYKHVIDDVSNFAISTKVQYFRWLLYFCSILIFFAILSSVIFLMIVSRISFSLLPVGIGFSIGIYLLYVYVKDDMSKSSMTAKIWVTFFGACLSGYCSFQLFYTFLLSTVGYDSISLSWAGVEFSLLQFSFAASIILSICTIAPALGVLSNSICISTLFQENLGPINGCLPKADETSPTSILSTGVSLLFELCIQFLSLVLVLGEMIIREQKWEDWNTSVDDVYPSYIFIATAFLVCFLAFHLKHINCISFSTSLWIFIAQISKLGHLAFDLRSLDVACIIAVSFSTLAPLIDFLDLDHLFDMVLSESDTTITDATLIGIGTSWSKYLVYSIEAILVFIWFYFQLSHFVLVVLFDKNPVDSQIISLPILLCALSMSLNSLLFLPSIKSLKILTFLVVFISFGSVLDVFPILVQYNSSSLFGLSISWHWDSQLPFFYSTAFLFFSSISCLLLVLSFFLKLISLRSGWSRLVFYLSLAILSSPWLVVLSYPASLFLLNEGIVFPMIHAVGMLFFGISVFMQVFSYSARRKESTSLLGFQHPSSAFLIVWIIGGALYGLIGLENHSSSYLVGITWSAMILSILLCVGLRLQWFLSDFVSSTASSDESSYLIDAVQGLYSTFSVLLSVVLVLMNNQDFEASIDSSIFVPMISLVWLTTKDGMFWKGHSSLDLVVVISMSYWMMNTLFSVFVRDLLWTSEQVGFEDTSSFGWFHIINEANISFYHASLWLSIGSVVFALISWLSVLWASNLGSWRGHEIALVGVLLNGLIIFMAYCGVNRFMACIAASYCSWRLYLLDSRSSVNNNSI